MYKTIEKAWNKVTDTRLSDFKNRVPSLTSLEPIKISKISENEDSIVLIFDSLGDSVSDIEDIPALKTTIMNWFKSFSRARIKRSSPQTLILELMDFNRNSLEEAVVRVFTRKGNNIVPSMKCVGGPKNGQRTQDIATCMQPPSYARRTARKISSRKSKGAMANKRRKTKLTNIIGRRKLSKANKRLKKARGGKF